jgi:cell division GTPase FtsZ
MADRKINITVRGKPLAQSQPVEQGKSTEVKTEEVNFVSSEPLDTSHLDEAPPEVKEEITNPNYSEGVVLMSDTKTSMTFAAVGVGQGGSRIAETFYKYGYPAAAINTAKQDLEYIQVPETNKLFLDFALGGVGKDITLGQEAVEKYTGEIKKFLAATFADKDVQTFLLCVTGGGGTGSGSVYPMVRILNEEFNMPVGVVYTLPKANEGPVASHNALLTLQKLANFAINKQISTLIVVDNARIEEIHPNLPVSKFWDVANQSIVDVLHNFNTLSKKPTPYEALDSMDFARIFTAGNCTIYGRAQVHEPENEFALADALLSSLETGLLAEGFNLGTTEQAGVIITGSQETLSKLKADHIEYAMYELNKKLGSTGVYRGIYITETDKPYLEIYTMYSGLGVPRDRIEALIKESKDKIKEMQLKASDTSKMQVQFESPTVSNKTEEKFKRIGAQRSAFGRITGQSSKRKLRDPRDR